MRIVRHLDPAPPAARGAAIALGNFDGMHLGHQAVIRETIARARALGAPSAMLTFEPHPRQVLGTGESAPFRITPFRVKARLAAELGVDHMIVLRFTRSFAQRSARSFIDDVLVAALAVRHVVTGGNFRFGRGREGDVQFLEQAALRQEFSVKAVPPVKAVDGTRYSSSAVRDRLASGDVRGAAHQLGRLWEIEGRVRHGEARGRNIGFPTANLPITADQLLPPLGVYAVRVTVLGPTGEASYDGVANLGRRPTFAGSEVRLEVHLFDFAANLYGLRLRVGFLDRVRPERRFDGVASLKAQIEMDCAAARDIIKATLGRSGAEGGKRKAGG
jgi:riboflavin kinase/FMN adenylyltransferase